MPIDEFDFAVLCSATVLWPTNLILLSRAQLQYCDRQILIAIDENGWQSTKLNDNVSKLIDQRQNWNEHSHILKCPRRNWKHIFFYEEVTKMGGKPCSNGVKNNHVYTGCPIKNGTVDFQYIASWKC